MKLKILGCGTSTGVPIPGCQCSVCLSSDPKNYRNRTSAVITTDSEEKILIDASPDLRIQALKWGVDQLDTVLFTHAHADHILGIDDLRAFNFISRAPLNCYSTETTFRSIRKTFQYLFDKDLNYKGGHLADLHFHYIKPHLPFSTASCEILPFELIHGKVQVMGFRIGNLAYATDCNLIPEQSIKDLQGIEILILDGLRFEPHPTHLSIPEAIEVARSLKASQTYLTHMTHTVDYNTASKSLPPGIDLAFDGLEIDF